MPDRGKIMGGRKPRCACDARGSLTLTSAHTEGGLMANILPPTRDTDTPQPTADELEGLLIAALSAGDMESVGIALRLMVGVDPGRASLLYDTLALGVAMRRGT